MELTQLEKAGILRILSELEKGEKRFSELSEVIPKATLARRLSELEELNYIEREIIPGRPPATIYRITDKGRRSYKELLKFGNVRFLVEDYAKFYPHEVLIIAKKYLRPPRKNL